MGRSEIGKRIRGAREQRGYSRETMAEIADMSATFLANIELGKAGFSEQTLIKLCHCLDISADYLLLGRGRESEHEEAMDLIYQLDAEDVPFARDMILAYVNAIKSKGQRMSDEI